MLLCKQVAQTEGVGFHYSDNIYGVPPVLIQHLQKFPILHEVNMLITNRAVPVPDVMHKERILVETLGLPGFYHCICRSAVWLPKPVCHLQFWFPMTCHRHLCWSVHFVSIEH